MLSVTLSGNPKIRLQVLYSIFHYSLQTMTEKVKLYFNCGFCLSKRICCNNNNNNYNEMLEKRPSKTIPQDPCTLHVSYCYAFVTCIIVPVHFIYR